MANINIGRKSGFIRRSGGMRRESIWIGIAGSVIAIAPLTPVLFTGLDAGTLAIRPFTVVRTRGVLSLTTDQVAATESYHAALGFAVVSDEALAVGITAVPTPMSEADSDLFFVYEAIIGRMLFSTSAGFDSGSGFSREFDSKAMRKVEDGQDIAITVEGDTSPFLGATIMKAGRMLLKLH